MCSLCIKVALVCLLTLGVFGPSLGEPLRAAALAGDDALGWKIEYGFDEAERLRRQVLTEYTYQYRPDGLIEAIREHSSAGAFLRRV